MELNADFSQRAVVHAAGLPWAASPIPGVERRMLDRVGGEVARATSIVRYAEGSRFAPHMHGGGEEFLVLDGVFQDEHGDYPAGTYVRNPPGSRHTPGAEQGCTIFVKLWQFDAADRTPKRVETRERDFVPAPDRPGVAVLDLFADASEQVRLERWAPRSVVSLPAPGGLEILVLDGGFTDEAGIFAARSWLRLPAGAHLRATASADGCRVWLKTGHLTAANVQATMMNLANGA